MSEEILINVTPSETRVAAVENGMLQEISIERSYRRQYLGNIYRGKVARVLPGMQAAFIEIGLPRAAFLHVKDMVRLHGDEEAEVAPPTPSISELVKEGRDVTVQVIKDPIGSKGARLTTLISLPSRYLVYLPGGDGVGVSVRIEDENERTRLREAVESIVTEDAAGGYIVRTNAEGVDVEALRADLKFLRKLWSGVKESRGKTPVGECIYEDLALPLRTLRDMLHRDVDRVRIDSRETVDKSQSFVARFIPEWRDRIELYSGERPIFDVFGVEDEIQRALERSVPLKSGGHLVIDQTEAMTTIDVNTGGYVGRTTLEETIYRTNLEAAQAIARQLRLRNLGGIIIIDFIDMEDTEHQRQVLRALEKNLARDPAKTNVTGLSELGLVQMTRKRTTESLERILCEPCDVCAGRGVIKTSETVCYEIFREITRSVRQFETDQLMVFAAPKVVDKILDEESATVAELEGFLAKSIRFQSEDEYAQDQYDVVPL